MHYYLTWQFYLDFSSPIIKGDSNCTDEKSLSVACNAYVFSSAYLNPHSARLV